MATKKLTLSSLVTIDGGCICAAFEQALKKCREDCGSRPEVSKARKVTLTATLVPVGSPDGASGSCDVQFEVGDSLPKRTSPTYNMKAARDGLLFNELSPENARQGTLDDVGAKRSPKRVV